MENNLHNNYLYRAIEAYPWELEKAIEALNYALSYDPENIQALCLMAKVMSEQLGENEQAKVYYEKALAYRIDFPNIYPDYIRLLVNNHDYVEAQKLIDYALTVKGIDRASILLNQAYLYEALEAYENAEKALKESNMYALNNEFITYVDDIITRVSKKKKLKNNENRKQENTQKKEEKKSTKSWLNNRLNNLL